MQRSIIILFFILNIYGSVCLGTVTLRQEIGQMLMLGFKGTELKQNPWMAQAIKNQRVGGVILFDELDQRENRWKNIKNPKQLKRLTQQLQQAAQQAANQHNNDLTPLLIAIDYEGGRVNRLKAQYGFFEIPTAAELGRRPDQEVRQYANRMAKTLSDLGINLDLAPVLDVNSNPDNPIIGQLGRSFSDDPEQVARKARIFTKAFNQYQILCAYKHFPGHGSSTRDSHKGFVDVTDTWEPKELKPYKLEFKRKNHCPILMTGHLVNRRLDPKGRPASLSKAMTTGLLREQLGFQGVVVTDGLQMKAITNDYSVKETVILAINSGADILIFANQIPEIQKAKPLIDIIEQAVREGQISRQRIDASYQRIMELKRSLK